MNTSKFLLSFFLLITIYSRAQVQYTNLPQNINGKILATPAGLMNGAYVFTIEFWVRTPENRSNDTYWQRPYLFGNTTDGNNSGDFGITTNNGYIGMWEGLSSTNTDQFFLSPFVRINDDQWHHIAAVNNGQAIFLYVDGNVIGSLTSGRALITNKAPLTFGAASLDFTWGGNLFNNVNFQSQGLFRDARFSNSVRYTANFTPQKTYVADGSTVALYNFGNQGGAFENNNNNNNSTSSGSSSGWANTNNSGYSTPGNSSQYQNNNQQYQIINQSSEQPATLNINGTIRYGRISFATKNFSLGNEKFIRFADNNAPGYTYFRPEEITGFEMGGSYFEPKLISPTGVNAPLTKVMVKRLTAPDSKIGMYQYDNQTSTKNAQGVTEYATSTIYLIRLPGSTTDIVYALSDNKFSPHFDEKVSVIVQDKPALADQIRAKNKDYFYAAFTTDEHRTRVWWNIINEYNKLP